MKRHRLVILLLGVVVFMSIASLPVLCQPAEDIVINQNITSFLNSEGYTTNDLVLAAQRTVDDHVKLLSGHAVVESPSAAFVCEGASCELRRLETAIYIKSHCPLWNTFLNDNPFLNFATEFVFDVGTGRVTTRFNVRRGTVEHHIDWSELTTSIEDISEIAAREIVENLRDDALTYRQVVSRGAADWTVRVNIDQEGLAEFELHIGYDGSLISVREI